MKDEAGANDVVPFTPHDHDVRIARDGWVYYVRGVKVGEPFVGEVTWDGSLVGLLMTPLLKGFLWALRRPVDDWKVGVLRFRDRRVGGRIRVVYKEKLPAGEGPGPRIGELVTAVEEGRFDK